MQKSRWSRSSDYWFYHIIFSGYTYRPALAPPPPRYQPNPAITYREEPSCTDYCCLACDSEYEWYKLEGKGRPYNPAYNYGNYRTNSETETSSTVYQSAERWTTSRMRSRVRSPGPDQYSWPKNNQAREWLHRYVACSRFQYSNDARPGPGCIKRP